MAPQSSPALQSSSRVERTVLENGVQICTEYVPGVRSISMSVMVACGSRHDGPREGGLAHLCEHLLFQGTTGRSAVQIARQMDGAGGDIGAFTARDYTCYYASVLDDYCFHALDLLGDVLLNPVLPEEALEREKRVIGNEIEQMRDVPQYRANHLLKGRIWPGHPLGQSIAGEPEALARVTREDAIYYFHRNYTPDRMTICASGNLDHQDFSAQARDAFWRLLGQGLPHAFVPVAPEAGVHVESRAGGQAYFCLGIPAPCYSDPRRYDVHLLARILGGGVSSRLFRALRESGLAYDVSAEYEAYREGGLLVIEGSSAAADLHKALSLALECAAGLITGQSPPDEEELGRAQTQIRAQHIIASQDVYTRMCRLGSQQLYFGRSIGDQEVLEAVGQSTVSSILESAASTLDFRRSFLTAVGPLESAAPMEDLVDRMCWSARVQQVPPAPAGNVFLATVS